MGERHNLHPMGKHPFPKATAQANAKKISHFVSHANAGSPLAAPTQLATTLHSTPTWKKCYSFDRFKQVEAREQAVHHGLVCLEEVEESLKQHQAHTRSNVGRYLDRIDDIRKGKKDCRILVGVMGASGAGKSSLLNALLESQDILPVDDERACTAACVEISWNYSEDPSSIYIAKIDRISREEWKVELQRLLKDIQDDALDLDGDDGEQDLERVERIKTAFQKIQCVYPHIGSKDELTIMTAENLLEHPNVKEILGCSKSISSNDLESFSAQIKPYIGSSRAKENNEGRSFEQWPLVTLVQLQIKAEILKHGIILVDLPGNMDTNAARSAIADNYQKNLTLTCVVAPTSRAASDKSAHDLLGRITQRNLQLDNHFSPEHLCFIVTKTDYSLNVERYIKNHSAVAEDLKDQLQKEAIHKSYLTVATEHIAGNRTKETATRLASKNLHTKIKRVEAFIREAQQKRGVPRRKKRKHESSGQENIDSFPSAEENKMTSERDNLRKELAVIEAERSLAMNNLNRGHQFVKRVENILWQIKSSKKAACIRNRNKVSMEEIRKYFTSVLTATGQDAGDSLQVFCVSALAFSEFAQNESAAVLGFRSGKESGIPALAKWLLETTLPYRDRNALFLLESLVSFETFTTPWVRDLSAEFKFGHEQQQTLLAEFEKTFGQLTKYFSTMNTQISHSVRGIIQNDLLNRLPKIEHEATMKAERTVRRWAQKPVVWSTHRAINRNYGIWESSNGMAYDWNDDLAGDYLNLVIDKWIDTLYKNVPAIRKGYTDNVCRSIHDCVQAFAIFVSNMFPHLSSGLQVWTEDSKRAQNLLKEHIQSIFDDRIKNVARDAHRLVKPKVSHSWTPVYEQCGEEKGKGLYKRIQQKHLEHVRSSSLEIFGDATHAIQASFDKLWTCLSEEFEKGTDCASAAIKASFGVMVEIHTLHVNIDRTAEAERDAKDQTCRRILDAFEELKKAWSIKIEETVQEEPELEPEDEISLADLYDSDFDDDKDNDNSNNSDNSDSDDVEKLSDEYHKPDLVAVHENRAIEY